MIRALPVLALVLLTACEREPSFDERYKAAEKRIRAADEEIGAELKKAETQTPVDTQAPAEVKSPGAT